MKILLHICCSNCALYPYKILKSEGHVLTGFWYNPNIHPHEEYNSRLDSLKRLELEGEWRIDVVYTNEYKPEGYFEYLNKNIKSPLPPLFQRGEFNIPTLAKGAEDGFFPSSTERCKFCYQLRLEKTAETARKEGFDAFSTTLLISPYQDFGQIVSTGKELADRYNILFHLKDYRPHFRDAMSLSKELGLYRQKYCGCIFSKIERDLVTAI